MSELDVFVGFGMLFMGIFVFSLIIAILSIIGQWKMFKKAGKEGWESLIPIYNQYVLCKIVGVNPIWIAIMFISFFISFIPILGFVSTIVSIYFPILLAVSTARSFGKDDVWGVGLFFFTPIFYMILGFGKSEYIGPKPMNDAILEIFGVKNETNNSNMMSNSSVNDSSSNVSTVQSIDKLATPKYCSACGSPIVDGAAYCANCGHKV